MHASDEGGSLGLSTCQFSTASFPLFCHFHPHCDQCPRRVLAYFSIISRSVSGFESRVEEVETAGVFPLSHVDEQPRNPAFLHTCFTGWSHYAWAVVEPEIADQLLQAQEGMEALFVLRHSWRAPDLLGRGPRCAVQACSLHQS